MVMPVVTMLARLKIVVVVVVVVLLLSLLVPLLTIAIHTCIIAIYTCIIATPTNHLHGRHFAHNGAKADEHRARGEVRLNQIRQTNLQCMVGVMRGG